MNLPNRLRLVRQSRNLKTQDVRDETGITNYDRMEQGRQSPKFDQLELICKALQINVWDLLAEELVITYKE